MFFAHDRQNFVGCAQKVVHGENFFLFLGSPARSRQELDQLGGHREGAEEGVHRGTNGEEFI